MRSKQKPQEIVRLYRMENPNIPPRPDGVVSHEDLVGQWFTPNLDKTIYYIRKSTQTSGRNARIVDGARLLVAEVPATKLEDYHVSGHPIAASMDVEGDNYIIPRDGTVPMTNVVIDEVVGELRGQLGNVVALREAQERIAAKVGELSLL